MERFWQHPRVLKAARITLLPGVLLRARHTLMLVTGADKAPALKTGTAITVTALASQAELSAAVANAAFRFVHADIRNAAELAAIFAECRPDLVLHQAAQVLHAQLRAARQDVGAAIGPQLRPGWLAEAGRIGEAGADEIDAHIAGVQRLSEIGRAHV